MQITELLTGLKKVLSHQNQHHLSTPIDLDDDCKVLINAFGGKDNIQSIDACLTRLRVKVSDLSLIHTEQIQSIGARGVIIIDHEVQAIFGRTSDKLKADLTLWLDENR
ncbi:glucose PTS transporter subunit EIIB [Celerinatantimonas yamalensis]|uniref:Glucose PTS transporter subunit EIIB n=1 Tax=Celerinatantimonas yamalensis TaxID=559956 RepID=A0ABW9G5H3_9GAMM